MQGQLCVQRADLLAVAVGSDRNRAVYITKLWCFQQRERRNALACGKLEGICNEGTILVTANLDFIGVRFAVVGELGFYAGFSDKRVKMSRSSNINLIVRDDGVKLLLGFAQS